MTTSDPRRVAITGASRGLGLELARQCARRGNRVLAGCRSPDAARDLRAVEGVRVLPLDVGDAHSIRAFADALGDGSSPLDLLFNNAGINAGEFGVDRARRGVLELDVAAFEAQMRVNAIGPMLLTRALLPQLLRAPRPVVVNLTSQLGALTLGARMRRDVGYNASKAALNMITVMTAGELADTPLVAVAIHPGWVRTDMGGPEAPLTAEEVAASILATVDGLGPADSGSFLRWDGSVHPW